MKRLMAAAALSVALLGAAAPAANASEVRKCTEVWVHFRPAVCTDSSTGGLWVCPDGYWNYCVQVLPIPV